MNKRYGHVICIILIAILLSSCGSKNRFQDQTMEFYISQYEMNEVVFNKVSSLDMLGIELYVTGYFQTENNKLNNENEKIEWALGTIDNQQKLLFVPLNSKYEIYVLDSPFPVYSDLLEEINNYNLLDDKVCSIESLSLNSKYSEFESLENIELSFHDYFTTRMLNSHFSARLGTCRIEEELLIVRIVSYNDNVVIIAHTELQDFDTVEIEIIELFILE